MVRQGRHSYKYKCLLQRATSTWLSELLLCLCLLKNNQLKRILRPNTCILGWQILLPYKPTVGHFLRADGMELERWDTLRLWGENPGGGGWGGAERGQGAHLQQVWARAHGAQSNQAVSHWAVSAPAGEGTLTRRSAPASTSRKARAVGLRHQGPSLDGSSFGSDLPGLTYVTAPACPSSGCGRDFSVGALGRGTTGLPASPTIQTACFVPNTKTGRRFGEARGARGYGGC